MEQATNKKESQHSITYLLDGFVCITTFFGDLPHLMGALAKLKQAGATPTGKAAAITSGQDGAVTDAPSCPIHQSKMKQGRNGWFCSRKDATQPNGYCAQKG